MDLLIIMDYYSQLEEWYKDNYAGYEEYYNEKTLRINALIKYALKNKKIKVFNALYPEMVLRYGPNINESIENFVKESGLIMDYDSRNNSSPSNNPKFLGKFENVYYCGVSLAQCILHRPHGYLHLKHSRKFLVKDAIFMQKGYEKAKLSLPYTFHDQIDFESMDDLITFEEKFLEINKFNTVTVDELTEA